MLQKFIPASTFSTGPVVDIGKHVERHQNGRWGRLSDFCLLLLLHRLTTVSWAAFWRPTGRNLPLHFLFQSTNKRAQLNKVTIRTARVMLTPSRCHGCEEKGYRKEEMWEILKVTYVIPVKHQCCLPLYRQSSQRGWPWPWPWWGGSSLDRPRTDVGTEPSGPQPLDACAPGQTRTPPAVSPSRLEAFGRSGWLGDKTHGHKRTLKSLTQTRSCTSTEFLLYSWQQTADKNCNRCRETPQITFISDQVGLMQSCQLKSHDLFVFLNDMW